MEISTASDASASPLDGVASPDSRRDFPLFWLAHVCAVLAVQAESVTLGWQVYTVARRTHGVDQSAFLVGMIGLAQFIPLFALALFAGAIADHHDRRRIAITSLALEIVCAGTLLVLASHPAASLVPVYVVAAVFGASRAFLSPALSAMGPMLVPRARLPRAISLNTLGDQVSSIIGPWIGGALCAVSASLAYAGAAGLYAVAIVALYAVRATTMPERSDQPRLAQIREGLAYVWTHRIVFGAISLDLFAVLLGGASALLPVFASDILNVGPHGFGVLRSGPAIGAAIMALILAHAPLRRRSGTWLFVGVAAYGLATLVFAVSRSLALSVAALVIVGASDMVSVYVRQSLVQIATPDAMRGRVSAVSGLFIGASAELGEFETGVVARLLGPVGAAIFGGLGSLVVTGTWAWRFPELRRADRIDDAG